MVLPISGGARCSKEGIRMRSTLWQRGALCALALMICVPALASAGGKDRSLDDCTSFSQEDKSEDTVAFTISNSCTIPVDCQIEWRVVCAPESKKRRSSKAGSVKLALTSNGMSSAEASAAACGDDAFTIDRVEWSCQPNKD
jgi:hypothetical protein